jgi:hypothetical protein
MRTKLEHLFMGVKAKNNPGSQGEDAAGVGGNRSGTGGYPLGDSTPIPQFVA